MYKQSLNDHDERESCRLGDWEDSRSEYNYLLDEANYD